MTPLDVAKKKSGPSAAQQAAVELVRLAQQQWLSLTGPDGLLKQLTKTVLEIALNEEMTEHLGYEKQQHFSAHLPQVLGRDQAGHQTDLHRDQRRRRPGRVRRSD